jgi:hypothetical protein
VQIGTKDHLFRQLSPPRNPECKERKEIPKRGESRRKEQKLLDFEVRDPEETDIKQNCEASKQELNCFIKDHSLRLRKMDTIVSEDSSTLIWKLRL